jgi:Domain of unknown function (DUF222)
MLQDPFPDLDDGEEPDGAVPPAGQDGPGQQGLFLSLPAEQFDPDQFAHSGPAKDMPPGALMATILNLVSGDDGRGFAGLSEDQLVGVISAGRRMESWSAWFSMAATGEFSRRHEGRGGRHEFAADELADELHLTWNSAAGQMDFARTVAERLPLCFAALRAGLIHPVDLRIIEEETRILSAADAAKADAILAGMAGTMTWGKLRHAAHRLVWDLDPEAVRKRQEAFKRETQVRKFREGSGNAGLIARELAADQALASWQHVEQRALDLRAAGVPGSLDELRVRAFLDLLQERDSREEAAAGPGSCEQAGTSTPPDDSSADDAPEGGPGGSGPGGSGAGPGGSGPGGSGGGPSGGSGSGRTAGWEAGPKLAALINITVPWTVLQRKSETPADVAGVRAGQRRRRPRPDRRRGTGPTDPVVRDRAAPRRHRRRARLRGGTAPAARRDHQHQYRHRARPAAAVPQRHDDTDRPRALRSRPRRGPVQTQPGPAAPDPRPQRALYRARLQPSGRPLRPGSYDRVGPGRDDVRVRPGSAVPASPSM